MKARRLIIGGALAAVVGALVLVFATDAASQEGRRRQGGTPASIQLTPDPLAIACDGVDSSTVTVLGTDASNDVFLLRKRQMF